MTTTQFTTLDDLTKMTHGSAISPLILHDVVIPAREEKTETLIPTVWAFLNCALVNHVIVVDDGLDGDVIDHLQGMRSFVGTESLLCVTGPREGKGQAVMAGLERVTEERVAFCDADLHNFTVHEAWKLCAAVLPDMMLIGVTQYVDKLYVPWSVHPSVWTAMSGERSLPTALVKGRHLHGYAMEVIINKLADEAGIAVLPVDMPRVRGTARWDERRQSEMERDAAWIRSTPEGRKFFYGG